MSIHLTQPDAYADLGDVWLRGQLARLSQKDVQFGKHCRIDADALLARLACTARAVVAPAAGRTSNGDRIRRATVEAIEHCARLERPFAQAPEVDIAH